MNFICSNICGRKSERCKEDALEQDDQNSISDDTDNRSEGSDHIPVGSVRSSFGSHLGYGFQQTKVIHETQDYYFIENDCRVAIGNNL